MAYRGRCLQSGVLVAVCMGRWASPAAAEEEASTESGIGLMDVHAALGVVALGTFSSALVIGSASGNLGKLTDPAGYSGIRSASPRSCWPRSRPR